jgi:hypothetical protein
VRTPTGPTDLLTADLVHTWGESWILPGRLTEDRERPTLQRLAVWALHLAFAAVMLVVVERAWPAWRLRKLAVAWTVLVVVVNLGKVVIDTRHPSLVTTLAQLVGGGAGLLLTTKRWFPHAVLDRIVDRR